MWQRCNFVWPIRSTSGQFLRWVARQAYCLQDLCYVRRSYPHFIGRVYSCWAILISVLSGSRNTCPNNRSLSPMALLHFLSFVTLYRFWLLILAGHQMLITYGKMLDTCALMPLFNLLSCVIYLVLCSAPCHSLFLLLASFVVSSCVLCTQGCAFVLFFATFFLDLVLFCFWLIYQQIAPFHDGWDVFFDPVNVGWTVHAVSCSC